MLYNKKACSDGGNPTKNLISTISTHVQPTYEILRASYFKLALWNEGQGLQRVGNVSVHGLIIKKTMFLVFNNK